MCPLHLFLDCIMTTCLSMCAPAQLSRRPKVTHLFIVTLQESLRDRVIESWLLLWQQLLRCCLWALFVSGTQTDVCSCCELWCHSVKFTETRHCVISQAHLSRMYGSVFVRDFLNICAFKQLCVVTVKTQFQQTEYVLRIMYCVF